jgi:serine/threonine protein kinase
MQNSILNSRYELERQIGEGGMARIYIGRDLRLNRRVAIKIPQQRLLSESDFLERFRHEAQAAAMLSHPNIVDIYDVGQDGDRPYIVMEYVDGVDLKTIINREAPITVDRALHLAEQIARGLYAAHRAGMIHRDVKPQNVLVTADGQAHVTDFGVAKSHLSTALTETGIAFGTVDYLAPEQAQGHPATVQSDLYALGVVLYEMLTGRLPFSGDTALAVAMKHVSEPPVAPRRLNPNIPVGLEGLILRMLAKDPAQRPRSAEEFARLLNSYHRLASQETTINASLSRPAAQGTVNPPPRPSPTGTSGRLPVPPRPTTPRAPRQEGVGCGFFFIGLLLLTSVLAVVYLFSTGMLSDLFVRGSGTPSTTPTVATGQPGTPTPTPTSIISISVPNLVGLSSDAADRTVRQAQLLPVRLEANDPQVGFNQVVRQEPAPGTLIPPGSSITFTVSLGPRLVEMPDVARVPAGIARQRLTAAGFAVEEIAESSVSVDAGFVIRQLPSAGLRVPEGQIVTIVISQGDVVRFPDLIGLQREQAEQLLNSTSGLILVYVDPQGRDRLSDYDRFRDNEVVSAQIEGGRGVLNGDLLPRGSRIILGIKKPEQP